MTKTVRDVMTPNPVSVQADTPIAEVAKTMREANIGDVIVLDDGKLCGIATDRDIVVRAIAMGKDPAQTRIGSVCSDELTTISPDNRVGDAMDVMRQKSIRRLPVVENEHAVGIVSLGDLAIEREPRSALAGISEAPANK